ncbi:uncharacterized protein LOC125230008 isoform X1 [Leguminivora glycinivorella]|uniref:uncharacterized protein LOC125230008 isoform X1 n=1 Tax=Leguminivora glycinivorella TaxID=1035111 RepID=UPI002010B8E5|nr:uncharacterized protein LOC125230008 isoform X1 [Leguminivora glycinivorella]
MRVSGVFRIISADRRYEEIHSTYKPIKRLMRLVSLNCSGANTSWELFWTVFKAFASASVLGFLTFYCLYIKIRYHYNDVILSIKLTDAVQMCYDYIQYLLDLFYVFKYGRETYEEYYKHMINIDQILITVNYSAIKSRHIKFIAYFCVILIITSAWDFTAWALSYGVLLPTLYATNYIYLLIKMLTTLDLMLHVMHVEYRLKCIVNQLQECYCETKRFPGDFIDSIGNKLWFYCESPSKPANTGMRPPDKILTGNNPQAVKWLSRCYLVLCEQCVFINNLYGTRILLNSLSLLIDMIRFTNIAVRLVTGSQPTMYASGIYPAAANILRMVTCALVIGTLVSQCERAYRQRDKALAVIDHILVGKEPDADLRSELTDLRGLIQSRPIQFHTSYFFRLEYGFLVSLVSVMVTYTIILIQSVN